MLLLVRDPDLVSLLSDFLSTEGFSIERPATEPGGRLVPDPGIDLVVAEASWLAESPLDGAWGCPVLVLAEMGGSPVCVERHPCRTLVKPVSLRTVGRALSEMLARSGAP